MRPSSMRHPPLHRGGLLCPERRFPGYGVDYANLGVETANLAAEILVNGADPAATPVLTFDNGTATINTETCAALGMDYAQLEELFAPLCTKVAPITTAESFDELAG